MGFLFFEKMNKGKGGKSVNKQIRELSNFICDKHPNSKVYFNYKKLSVTTIRYILAYLRLHIGLTRKASTYCECLWESDKYEKYLDMTIGEFANSTNEEKLLEFINDIKAVLDDNLIGDYFGNASWKMSDIELYSTCYKNGVTNLDSEYAVLKLFAVANSLLFNSGIEEKYYSLYLNKDDLFELFESGKAKYTGGTNNDLYLRQRSIIDTAHIIESKYAEVSDLIKDLPPIRKRSFMLDKETYYIDDLIEECKLKKENLNNAITGLEHMPLEQKKDWAILGGVADAIAGPGAGFAVAVDAMIENEAIEKRNQQQKQLYGKLAFEMMLNAPDYDDLISQAKERKMYVGFEETAARSKVILEQFTTEEIFSSLNVDCHFSKDSEDSRLRLEITIENCVDVSRFPDIKFTVDGTIKAEIFKQEEMVDTVYIALPVYGIVDEKTIVSYSDCCEGTAEEYSVTISPNKLWVIEL